MENKINITKTANASDLDTAPRIFTTQEAYILDKSNYRILRSEDSSWKDWTTKLLFVFIGSLFTLIAKVLEKLSKQEELNIGNWYFKWEVWVCIISLIAFLIISLFSHFTKSERKELVKEIDLHFEKSKKLIKVEIQS
ncbi:MAG: hypothetical protein JST15_00745 [Bacteroidetes bacterium]|nr:hypothetical protein [Bacteroidota bacterium]